MSKKIQASSLYGGSVKRLSATEISLRAIYNSWGFGYGFPYDKSLPEENLRLYAGIHWNEKDRDAMRRKFDSMISKPEFHDYFYASGIGRGSYRHTLYHMFKMLEKKSKILARNVMVSREGVKLYEEALHNAHSMLNRNSFYGRYRLPRHRSINLPY